MRVTAPDRLEVPTPSTIPSTMNSQLAVGSSFEAVTVMVERVALKVPLTVPRASRSVPEIVSGVRIEPESATAVDDPRWTSSSVIARSVGFIVIFLETLNL